MSTPHPYLVETDRLCPHCGRRLVTFRDSTEPRPFAWCVVCLPEALSAEARRELGGTNDDDDTEEPTA